MMFIGITGGSGCGKSTFSAMLEKSLEGAVWLKIDRIMFECVRAKLSEVRQALGVPEDYVDLKGACVRDLELRWLDVVRGDMSAGVEKFISELDPATKIVLLDWVYLPYLPVFEQCDLTIRVFAGHDVRLERLRHRYAEEHSEPARRSHLEELIMTSNVGKNLEYDFWINNSSDQAALQSYIEQVKEEVSRLTGVANVASAASAEEIANAASVVDAVRAGAANAGSGIIAPPR